MNVDKIYKIQRNIIMTGVFSVLLWFILIGFALAADKSSNLAKALEWKYGNVADTCQKYKNDVSENPEMMICAWYSIQPQPNAAQISRDIADYEAYVSAFNAQLSQEKDLIYAKLKITKTEFSKLSEKDK